MPNIAVNAASAVGRPTACVHKVYGQTFLRNTLENGLSYVRCRVLDFSTLLRPSSMDARVRGRAGGAGGPIRPAPSGPDAGQGDERVRLLRIARAKRTSTGPSAAPSIRGVFCNICGAYGEHSQATCPNKSNEGCPDNLRKRTWDQSRDKQVGGGSVETGTAVHAAAKHVDTKTTTETGYYLPPPATIRPAYCDLPDDYLPVSELESIVIRRPDAPSFLRCYACAILARDAIWCSCCDVLACRSCLFCVGHVTDKDNDDDAGASWTCPKCNSYLSCGAVEVASDGRDGFSSSSGGAFVVTAIRFMINAWKRNTMEAIDPYSKAVSVLTASS